MIGCCGPVVTGFLDVLTLGEGLEEELNYHHSSTAASVSQLGAQVAPSSSTDFAVTERQHPASLELLNRIVDVLCVGISCIG